MTGAPAYAENRSSCGSSRPSARTGYGNTSQQTVLAGIMRSQGRADGGKRVDAGQGLRVRSGFWRHSDRHTYTLYTCEGGCIECD